MLNILYIIIEIAIFAETDVKWRTIDMYNTL